ncbi:Plasmid stabilization system [Candidatus Terasakiella magnetica]|nr:Plasmid stabilization system [Candidatus Terasakiella magnetica]
MPPPLRLIWSDAAQDDLYLLRAGLADDCERAKRIGRIILDAADCVADYPERGTVGTAPGTRELPLPGLPWRLVYRQDYRGVVILRLLA